jgi:phage-related protein
MAFDAGTIMARLDLDLSRFDDKLREAEARSDKAAAKDRKIKVTTVFDDADTAKARKVFADLDNMLSRDAMNRLRSSPQGSVLGALNALFSPHQVTGAPTAQQSASQGMLGRMLNPATNGQTTTQNVRQRLISAAAGPGMTTQNVRESLLNQVGPGTATQDVREQLIGGVPAPGTATEKVEARLDPESSSKLAADSAKAGEDAGDKAGSGFTKRFSLHLAGLFIGGGGDLRQTGSKNLDEGLLGGIGPGILGLGTKLTAGIGLGGSLLGALPALGAVGAGAGVLGGGIAAVLGSSKQLQDQAKSMLDGLKKTIEQAAQPLVAPLRAAFRQIPQFVSSIMPEIKSLFSSAAPLLKPLLDGIESLVRGLLPGLVTILHAAMPAFTVFAQILGTLGKDLGSMFSQFAPVLSASSVILKALLDLVSSLFPIIGQLAAVFASALAPAFKAFASVVQGLLPILVPLGRILSALAAAVLGDLVSAFTAVASLVRDLAPSFRILSSVLSNVFQVMENAGVFAILGDALENIAPLLARLINTLVGGLAPILGPITQMISALAGTAIKLLTTALDVLIPIAIELINDVLRPLVPTIRALIPIVTVVAQVLGAGLGAALKALAPVLAAIAPYILAIITAIKLWSIAQAALDIVLDANPIGAIVIALAALGVAIYELVTHWRTVWGEIKSLAEDAWKFIWDGFGKYLLPLLGPAGLIALGAIELVQHWQTVCGLFKSAAQDLYNWLWNDFGLKISDLFTEDFPHWFDQFIQFMNNDLIGPMRQGLQALYNWVWNTFVQPLERLFTVNLPNAFRQAVRAIGSAWDAVENAVKAPVNWVITHVINGLINAFDWVSGKVGGPHIADVPGLAKGGKIPGYGGGDSVLALVEPGEAVIDKDKTRQLAPLLKVLGIPGFQGGGIIGGIGSALGDIGHGVTSVLSGIGHGVADTASILSALATGNTTALINTITKMAGIGQTGGAIGDLASLLVDIPKTLASDAIHDLLSFFDSIGGGGFARAGAVSGTVLSWFEAAIKATGVPASWLGDLEIIAHYESGDNPNAINLSDSNAKAGDPSRGIMQTIMSTFDAYHQPGTSFNIYNPIANIAAAINYIKSRYGTVANVPGIVSLAHGGGYVGYDSGGWLPPGATLAINNTTTREAVLTPAQSKAFIDVGEAARLFSHGLGQTGSSAVMRDLYLTMPEGTTVAQALQEISWRLMVARQQGAG